MPLAKLKIAKFKKSAKDNLKLLLDGARAVLANLAAREPQTFALVQQGHGYTILPAFSLTMRNLSDALQLNEIIQPRLTRGLNIAISSQRPLSRAGRESIKLIQQHIGGPAAIDWMRDIETVPARK